MNIGNRGHTDSAHSPRQLKRLLLVACSLLALAGTACEPLEGAGPGATINGGQSVSQAPVAAGNSAPAARESASRPVTTAPPTTAAPTTVAPTTTTTAAPAPPVTALGFDARGEDQFLRLVNAERRKVGVGNLRLDGGLINQARLHAKWMADNDSLEHQSLRAIIGPPWSTMAENIAYGPSIERMHRGLVDSRGHYVNMVNPSYTHIGIGVFTDQRGRTWTAHLFGG